MGIFCWHLKSAYIASVSKFIMAMKVIKLVVCFFILCLAFVGVVGAIGITLSSREYFITVCVAVLAIMAIPTAEYLVNIIKDYHEGVD